MEIVLIVFAKNTPNASNILAAQTQKFGFFEGKAIARWVSVVRILTNSMSYKVKNNLKFKET
jgi:hypothetical protein